MCSPDVNMHHMHKVYSKLSFVDSAESSDFSTVGEQEVACDESTRHPPI